jgi:hypothetical protein
MKECHCKKEEEEKIRRFAVQERKGPEIMLEI